jgi:hypothetical protein
MELMVGHVGRLVVALAEHQLSVASEGRSKSGQPLLAGAGGRQLGHRALHGAPRLDQLQAHGPLQRERQRGAVEIRQQARDGLAHK